MKKIISALILALFISMSIASIVDADVNINGAVDVEVKEWVGIVYPSINIENQSVTFEVNASAMDNETTYTVEDTLIIGLNVTKESNRTYVFPRSIFYSAIMTRKITDIKLLPLRGILSRVFPIRQLFKSVNVAKGMLGKEDANISITLDYIIDNKTYNNGENLTLHLYMMGFLPGDVNGISKILPFITYKDINLEIDYIPK